MGRLDWALFEVEWPCDPPSPLTCSRPSPVPIIGAPPYPIPRQARGGGDAGTQPALPSG